MLTQTDSYKLSHKGFMTDGTEMIYSNLTARNSKYLPVIQENYDAKVVVFGMQGFIKEVLIEEWNNKFFNQPKDKVIAKYARIFRNYLGYTDTKHFEELHDLGYLPIEIKALPEGTLAPVKVPMYTIRNTHRNFAWLTNYLETLMSCELWKQPTVATIIREFRRAANKWALKTTGSLDGTEFIIHGFEFRGMSGRQDAAKQAAAFLLSSCGTDTIPAIEYIEDYYNANTDEQFIATSVPASEHSLASTGIAVNGELETYRKWITKDYPTGIVSIISDTLDFFEVITTMATELKDDILSREVNDLGLAKVVFRPDSGEPIHILTGYKVYDQVDAYNTELEDVWNEGYEAVLSGGKYFLIELYQEQGENAVRLGKALSEAEIKGAVECLWEIFGGTVTDQGYKVLNERVGLIYGDSITLERQQAIYKRLADKGFASVNCVMGVGSYTCQYLTRDSLGMAVKATAAKVNGEIYELYKDPKTDDGTKKSAKGLLRVDLNDKGELTLFDQQTEEQEKQGMLQPVFRDGVLLHEVDFLTIRERIWND